MADTLPKTSMDPSRRAALVSTCVVGCAGAAGVAIPLVSTFQPSERAKAAGAPVEADIAGMAPGELRRVEWRGKPVWLIRRTPKMLESLNETQSQVLDPDSDGYYQIPTPEYAKNQHRSIKPEYLVVVGICSHLGCSPSERFAPGAQPSVPLPWLHLRHGGSGIQEQAGQRQPRRSPPQVHVGHHAVDRC